MQKLHENLPICHRIIPLQTFWIWQHSLFRDLATGLKQNINNIIQGFHNVNRTFDETRQSEVLPKPFRPPLKVKHSAIRPSCPCSPQPLVYMWPS